MHRVLVIIIIITYFSFSQLKHTVLEEIHCRDSLYFNF